MKSTKNRPDVIFFPNSINLYLIRFKFAQWLVFVDFFKMTKRIAMEF